MAARRRFKVPSYRSRDRAGGGGFIDAAYQRDIALAKRFGFDAKHLENRRTEEERTERAKQADAALAARFGYTEDVLAQQARERRRAEAAAARAQMRAFARELQDDTSVREFRGALLRAADAYSDDEVLSAIGKVRADVRAYRKGKAEARSVKGRVLGALGAVFDVIDAPIEQGLRQPYYSAKRAEFRGAGVGTQFRAGFAGLPGLGFLAGSGRTRRDVEDVNSRAERERLTKQGQLASFGEVVTGRAESKLRGRALAEYRKATKGFSIQDIAPDRASGGFDAGLEVFGDPLNVAGAGAAGAFLSPLRRGGSSGLRMAGRAGGLRAPQRLTTGQVRRQLGPQLSRAAIQEGREAYLREATLGRALVEEVEKATLRYADPKVLAEKLKIGTADAEALLAAKRQGRTAIREATAELFATGRLNPEVGLGRQALLSATRGKLGRGALSADAKLRAKAGDVLRSVRDDVPTATAFTSKSLTATRNALRSALNDARVSESDFYKEVVAPDIGNMDNLSRLARVYEMAEATGNPGFMVAVEDALGSRIAKGATPTDLNRLVNSPEFDGVLRQMESLAAVLAKGGKPAQRAAIELAQGFTKTLTGTEAVTTAARRAGLTLQTSRAKVTDERIEELRQQIEALPDDDIRSRLLADFNKAAESRKGLGRVETAVKALDDPDVLDEARNIIDLEAARQAAATPTKPGLGLRSLLRPGAELLLSFSEAVPPSAVPFEGTAAGWARKTRRIDALDRWTAALGHDDFSRQAFRAAAGEAKTEEQLYLVVKNAMRALALAKGVDPEALVAVAVEARKRARQGKATFVDADTGEVLDAVQTLSQRGEHIPLPDPADVRRTIEELAALDGSKVAAVKAGLRKASDSKLANFARRVHVEWKFNVVTNLYAPAIGGVAGFVGTDGSLRDKVEGGAAGAVATGVGIGLFGSVRYLGRVVGLEEKARYFMLRGFAPDEWVPVLTKWTRRRGLDRPFLSPDLIKANVDLTAHLRHPLLAATDNDFVKLGRKQPRFVDAWWKVVNHQLHIETDTVADVLLQERAGLLTPEQATRHLTDFFKTPDGKLWLRRMRGGYKGPKTEAEALTRYRKFIETYVPEDVALARLDGEVSRELLKTAVKVGTAPEAVHALKTWTLPRSARQAALTRNNIASRLILEGPTTKFNRLPLAEHLYRDEYLRLRAEGVDADTAQELADEFAVRRTNSVMFNVNDESRFARRVDFVFPFQQPREELLRVWGKLALSRPGRTMQAARLGALAFNNGAENGVFSKDPVSGEWTFTVPGSAYLGRALFGYDGGPFQSNLRDLLFFAQGAYGVNLIPSPGGPWWAIGARTLLDTDGGKELYAGMPDAMKELLFPYGNDGRLSPNGATRLWMAMTADTPPWEFASAPEQEDALNRVEQEVVRHLLWRHLQENPGDTDWVPSEDDIKTNTRALLKTWALFTGLSPAAPRPLMVGAEQAQAVRDAYTDPISGSFDFAGAIRDYPMLEPYFRVGTKKTYRNPDEWKPWTKEVDWKTERILRVRRYKTAQEYLTELKDARRRSEAWDDYWRRVYTPDFLEREQLLIEWRAKYPDIAKDARHRYFRELELARILRTTGTAGEMEALEAWRKRHDLTPEEFKSSLRRVKAGNVKWSPWRVARDTEDVVSHVRSQIRKGFSEEVVVSLLAPAEQVRWWNNKLIDLSLAPVNGNARDLLNQWNLANKQRAELFRTHPELRGSERNRVQEAIGKWRGDFAGQLRAIYAEADKVREAMNRAAEGKDWKSYYALKDKRNALYDAARELKNGQYRQHADDPLRYLEEEIKATVAFVNTGNKAALERDLALLRDRTEFLPSNEESWFLRLPANLKGAYVEDLVTKLETPSGQKGKLFWQWLTDFQRDVLESNLSPDQIEGFKREAPGADGGGSGRTFGGKRIGEGGGELAFAIELFKQYNRRPAGAKPPAAYDEYLKLPNNPVIRADFLDRHPEVAAWIKAGPMANMPDVLRYLVANIMVKHGRWEGEVRDLTEITELAFAREQLRRWNRREGRERPTAYDAWLAMPTGVEKAEYLKAHPEVTEWIQLGPMANMPDEYRDVVRDVMLRYGEWTERQDPLGEVIAGYYQVPSYAREDYLRKHPELVEYWAALRSPEEQAMYDLADRYFAMPDGNPRRLFLAAHPELQAFFVEQRTKRYERFLNRVAQYMGQNPEIFEDYLERQEDVLAELLAAYATAPLMRERRLSVGVAASSEAGRERTAA